MADVAARAGVGIGTVSRVLNDSPNVRPETRAAVRQVMEELGYRRARAGASVQGERRGLVGVLVPFFDEPSAYQRLSGIVRRLQPHGYEVVLHNVDTPDAARNRVMELPRQNLDGLIVISLPLQAQEGERLADARFPVVLVDTWHPALPSVRIDDRAGGRLATQHLLDLGHERVAFIGEPRRNPFGFVSSAYREEGYRAAMADAGLEIGRGMVKYGAHLRAAARQLATELFAQALPPTAIVAASDVQAIGVLEAARNTGRELPGELSVIGYDDIELAAHVGLTTVRQPLEESGQRGADLLVEALVPGAERRAFIEELPLELVSRGTTGPAPRAVGRQSGRRRLAAG